MNTFGKSIRIYLKDGTVTGIKFGEVMYMLNLAKPAFPSDLKSFINRHD